MDDKKIRAFLTVVEFGSLRRAAEQLNYTQSGLTQLIKNVEQELGCQLLQRSHSGVMLTGEGAYLLPLFREADSSLSQLRRESERLSGRKRQIISLGTFPSVAKSWLPHIIREYHLLHPEISLELRLGGDEVMDFLSEGIVDLVLSDQDMCREYRFIPLHADPLLAVFPKDSPLSGLSSVTPEQLGRYPFIIPVAREMRDHILPWSRGCLRQSVVIAAADDSSLLSLVEQGIGVTILPELTLRNVHQVAYRPLAPSLQRLLGLALPRSTTPAVREFAAFLQEYELT